MTTTLAAPGIEIVCPSWCRLSPADHLADLSNYEGRCAHWSPEVHGKGWVVDFSTYTLVDGTPEPDSPKVWVDDSELEPAEARALALAILSAADAVEATS